MVNETRYLRKSENCKNFYTEPLLTVKRWTEAYNWSRQNKLRDEISGMMECYIEPENSSLITHRTVTRYRKLLLKSRWSSFQDYINWRYSAWVVRINVDNWREATCTCPNFLKNYICKHSLGMAIRLKALNCVVPAISKNIPIGQKRRRGRPKLARPALIVQ